MSDVLPTDCSPRNTSLNFLSGLPKSPEVDMVRTRSTHSPQHFRDSVSRHNLNSLSHS